MYKFSSAAVCNLDQFLAL